jgi:hypothetical protein
MVAPGSLSHPFFIENNVNCAKLSEILDYFSGGKYL